MRTQQQGEALYCWCTSDVVRWLGLSTLTPLGPSRLPLSPVGKGLGQGASQPHSLLSPQPVRHGWRVLLFLL